MYTKSTLRATARPFYPRSQTTTPTTNTHSGPPTPYITAVEPYQAHPVTYVQMGPNQHVPLYIYHQVRGIYIGSRFHPQQEQYFYSYVPPPPQPPVSPVANWSAQGGGSEWWSGEGEGTWGADEYGGFKLAGGFGGGYGYGEKGYGYGGQKFKNGKGYGKKGYGGKKKGWGYRGKKKGERYADDQVTLVGRDSAVFG